MHLCLRHRTSIRCFATDYTRVIAAPEPQSNRRQDAVYHVAVTDTVTIAIETLLTIGLRIGVRNDVTEALFRHATLTLRVSAHNDGYGSCPLRIN